MGRYSTELAGPPPAGSGGSCGMPGHNHGVPPQAPWGSNPGMPQGQPVPPSPANWPTTFDKPIVALDLNGTIIEDVVLKGASTVKPIPGALEAIRTMRLKGYKVFILSDQPSISKGLNTTSDIDVSFSALMGVFGQAGIFSIDGFLYNTSEMKEDEYAKPNIGMVTRAEKEVVRGARFKDGWYVGDSFVDLKFADKIGSKPILIKSSSNSQHAIEQLEKHTYKDIKTKTKVFNTLLEFANSLP